MNNYIFKGGRHTHHHHYPTQQQLQLESKKTLGVRLEPSIIDILEAKAKMRGMTPSLFARRIIKKYLEHEESIHDLHNVLEDIVV